MKGVHNDLVKLYKNISDEELLAAISEIEESEETGIITSNGVIRKYARLSGEITGGYSVTDFLMTQLGLLKEAAFRWRQMKEIE